MIVRPVIRKVLMLCSAGSVAALGALWFNPEHNKMLCLVTVGAIGMAWTGTLILTWSRKLVRAALLALPLLLLMTLFLPGQVHPSRLRESYLASMDSYEGVPYYWGGECGRGIDCSGLPRRALRDALLKEGTLSLDGKALRSWIEQWWYDASAQAISEGYRQYAAPLHIEGAIKNIDTSRLIPGDLAVTRNGVHMLVYRGEDNWIQADPGSAAVVSLNGKKDFNPWFSLPVTLHRWNILKDSNSKPPIDVP